MLYDSETHVCVPKDYQRIHTCQCNHWIINVSIHSMVIFESGNDNQVNYTIVKLDLPMPSGKQSET